VEVPLEVPDHRGAWSTPLPNEIALVSFLPDSKESPSPGDKLKDISSHSPLSFPFLGFRLTIDLLLLWPAKLVSQLNKVD
jgi:hypothetical protein